MTGLLPPNKFKRELGHIYKLQANKYNSSKREDPIWLIRALYPRKQSSK